LLSKKSFNRSDKRGQATLIESSEILSLNPVHPVNPVRKGFYALRHGNLLLRRARHHLRNHGKHKRGQGKHKRGQATFSHNRPLITKSSLSPLCASLSRRRKTGLPHTILLRTTNEYPGAYYHITSRGNERKVLYKRYRDREKFLGYLETASR